MFLLTCDRMRHAKSLHFDADNVTVPTLGAQVLGPVRFRGMRPLSQICQLRNG